MTKGHLVIGGGFMAGARFVSKGRYWTPGEDETLLAMKTAGMTYAQIGAVLDRTGAAVSNRHYQLRTAELPQPEPAGKDSSQAKIRICLGQGCGKPFRSSHSMNRLCGKCRRVETSPYQP